MMLYQTKQSSVETRNEQSAHQEKVLAREIARSAYNAASSRAREAEMDGKDNSEIAALINSGDHSTGSYQGGTYEVWARPIEGSSYAITATGWYGDAEYEIGGGHTLANTLEVPCEGDCEVTVQFEESQAGYCSAIFLQRMVPKSNNGHGNNADGVDNSNKGNSKAKEDGNSSVDDEAKRGSASSRYHILEPELVFAPGNNRDGAEATYKGDLVKGTLLNFIMAVDADYNCEKRGENVSISDPSFNYTRPALKESSDGLRQLEESVWTITEAYPKTIVDGVKALLGEEIEAMWRISYEDLRFTSDQLEDIKVNGYPRSGNSARWNGTTYSGQGWSFGPNGLVDLKNYGRLPDFSDQVIRVWLTKKGTSDGSLAGELEQAVDNVFDGSAQ